MAKSLEALFSGKIRLKLLVKLFLNPENQVHLRGLAKEFEVSTNTVRQELSLLKELEFIKGSNELTILPSETDKQLSIDTESKNSNSIKSYTANTEHPLYEGFQKLIKQYVGIDQIVENVINKIGDPSEVYVTGDLAKGKDVPIIDLILIGDAIDEEALHLYISKTEDLIQKKIRAATFNLSEWQERKEEFEKIPLLKIY